MLSGLPGLSRWHEFAAAERQYQILPFSWQRSRRKDHDRSCGGQSLSDSESEQNLRNLIMLPLWTEVDPGDLLRVVSTAGMVFIFLLFQILAPSGRV